VCLIFACNLLIIPFSMTFGLLHTGNLIEESIAALFEKWGKEGCWNQEVKVEERLWKNIATVWFMKKKSAIRKYGKERTVTRSIRYKPGNAEYFWLAFRQESHFLFLSLLASLRGSSTIRKNKQSKNTEGWEHETKKGLFVWSVYHVRCLADWF